MEYAYRLTQKLDLTVGGGQSISGFRGGLGARFFLRDKAFSPFIAGNLIYSSGIDGLEFDANGTIATYDMPSRVAGFAKVGLKLGIGKHVALMGAVGYAQPLVNSQPVLVSGTDTDLHRTAMEVTNLGGVELSTALQIRF
ncbi:MAG TPA: hypothetical protein DCP28_31380 [Cytophagales bacterium]|nr:hypothetical protein [Cytophagales bacterium]